MRVTEALVLRVAQDVILSDEMMSTHCARLGERKRE